MLKELEWGVKAQHFWDPSKSHLRDGYSLLDNKYSVSTRLAFKIEL